MKLKVFFASLFVGIVASVGGTQSASALVPTDIPAYMASAISAYDPACPGMPEKYFLGRWISPAGQPTQTSITVPFGTTDVPLQYNNLVFVCRQLAVLNGATYPGLPRDGIVVAGALTENRRKATSGLAATNGSLINTGPLLAQTSIFADYNSRYWFAPDVTFTYRAGSPLTTSQIVTVSFNGKNGNLFGSSTVHCAETLGLTGPNLDACNEEPISFQIVINVAPSPQASVQGFAVNQATGAPINMAAEGASVHLANVGTTQNQPFSWSNFNPGNRQFFMVISPTSQYEIVGSTVCNNLNCLDPGVNSGGWYYQAGSSRTWNFQSGELYNARWIVRVKQASVQGYVITPGGAATGGSTIHVQNVGTSSTNPFFVNGIPTGTRQFFIGSPPGFTVVGSNICRSSGSQAGIPQCAAGLPGFSNPGGQGWAPGSNRNIDFAPGITYDVRWIVQPLITCNMVFAPNLIDPATPFSVTGTASGPSAAVAYGLGANQMTFEVTGPTTQTRTVNPTSLSGTNITGTANFTALGTAGTYTITMRLGGVFAASACSTQIRVVSFMPTFTARNADIVAGMTLPYADTGICAPPDTSAGIVGWNQALSTTPDFIGSGGNLGAMALNAIQGYATGTGGTGGGGIGGGISFANSPAASYSYADDTGRFGGDLRAFTTSCSPDYYAQRLTEPSLQAIPGSSMNSWNGAYAGTGNVTLSGANNLPQYRHIRIYVDGNVRITGNISFSNGLSSGLSDRDKIPSVWIITTGNIYVDSSVSELNAILVAQGTSTNPDSGGFYSCNDSFTSFVPGVSLYDYAGCSAETLTVNGSVIANRLILTRSRGTIGATIPQTYAEVFNYSPLSWLSISGIGGSPTGSGELNNEYQAITSLPPVL